jgi:hypothetical protein
LQELAEAAVKSGLDRTCIKELAGIGSNGNQPGNASRDLFRILPQQAYAPEPYAITLILKNRNRDTGVMEAQNMKHDVILPTDWFSSLDASGFAERLVGTKQTVQTFWDQVSNDDPKFYQNPFYTVEANKHGAVPLVLFGDGAQHAEHDSVKVVAFRSMLTDVSVSDSMFLFTALPKSASCKAADEGHNTWDTLWQVLCWNLSFLALGIHPTADHENKSWAPGSTRAALAGKPLCPKTGLKGVIWVIASDYEFLEQEFGFKNHAANEPCCWCSCNTSTIPHNDFSKGALWRNHVKTTQDHRRNPQINHPIMNVTGVVFEMFHLDALHCLDLGVAEHVIGNVLNDICSDHFTGQSKNFALAEVNRLIHQAYDELDIPAPRRIPYLSYSHFSKTPYPCLKHIKGSRVRAFAPVAVVLATIFESEDRHTQHRLAMCQALQEAYNCIQGPAMFWDATLHQKFQKAVFACLAHYQWLAKWSMTTTGKEYRYSMVTKHHYSVHLVQQAKYLAPRYTWTYGGETFMGLIASLTQACVRGRKSNIVASSVQKKFIYAKLLRLSGLLEVSHSNYFSEAEEDFDST